MGYGLKNVASCLWAVSSRTRIATRQTLVLGIPTGIRTLARCTVLLGILGPWWYLDQAARAGLPGSTAVQHPHAGPSLGAEMDRHRRLLATTPSQLKRRATTMDEIVRTFHYPIIERLDIRSAVGPGFAELSCLVIETRGASSFSMQGVAIYARTANHWVLVYYRGPVQQKHDTEYSVGVALDGDIVVGLRRTGAQPPGNWQEVDRITAHTLYEQGRKAN